MHEESKQVNNSLQCSLFVSTDHLSLEQAISDVSKIVAFFILLLFTCCVGSFSSLLFGGGVLGNLNR